MQTVTLSAKAVAAWIICLMQITSYTLRIVIGPDFKIRSGYFYQFESPRPDWLDSDFIPRLLTIFENFTPSHSKFVFRAHFGFLIK